MYKKPCTKCIKKAQRFAACSKISAEWSTVQILSLNKAIKKIIFLFLIQKNLSCSPDFFVINIHVLTHYVLPIGLFLYINLFMLLNTLNQLFSSLLGNLKVSPHLPWLRLTWNTHFKYPWVLCNSLILKFTYVSSSLEFQVHLRVLCNTHFFLIFK